MERVLNELDRLPFHEIIAVVNGSTDGSFEKIRKHRAGVTILHYEEPLGHDVGRAIGARVSTSDILLFADGDLPIRAEKLLHFVEEIEKGADVALNDITPYLRPFSRRDAVSTVKEFVNRALGRPDLMANSLTAVPHALSRKALERIGAAALAVPPLAQVIAIQSGLRIKAPASVNIIRGNRRRASNSGHLNPVSRLIAGDHLEALHRALHKSGSRLHYKDHMRRREYAEVGR
ncbi:glycosyltransferase [Paenibacillus sp. CC-CFT747]|nr:glycosyltransferase [Paenibacillus sp. CC-CFT747]